ncbi:MAG TPA: hypothetical protein VEI02_00760, partial [Planctomycetota bacterium]|nr:hypothetical protein [Planctomycetota bacterium]
MSSAGFGQCVPGFADGFALRGADSTVRAFATFDDGTGPALYAGGDFSYVDGTPASRIARWNGSTWSPLGSGIQGASVRALAVFDDGSGPALYASGLFTGAGGLTAPNIARWNGSAWSPVGAGLGVGPSAIVHALLVFDDGTGEGLYAGGEFMEAAGAGLGGNGIARWNGSTWQHVGVANLSASAGCSALALHDDGSGVALYAAGTFSGIPGVFGSSVIKRVGTTWTPVGGPYLNGGISTMASYQGSSGPCLAVAGNFSVIGGGAAQKLARWDGANWAPLTNGFTFTPTSVGMLANFDDGSGPALYFVGRAHGAESFCKWNGAAWQGVAGTVWTGSVDPPVIFALTRFDDGSGPQFYLGGAFTNLAGVGASRVARWNGAAASTVGDAPLHGLAGFVDELEVADLGNGPELYAGGVFDVMGGLADVRVARWNGVSWTALPQIAGQGYVGSLAAYDDGGGTAVYAAMPDKLMKWDGSNWTQIGTPMAGPHGTTIWSLHVHDDGSGPALYAGGVFGGMNGVPASLIARWNGATWSAVGNPATLVSALYGPGVSAFASYDDGTGTQLYAGGNFTGPSGIANVARWNGSTWSAVGAGIPMAIGQRVYTFSAFTSGGATHLYAGGDFGISSGSPANRIAKWNGSAWSGVGSGLSGNSVPVVLATTVYDDGSDPSLFTGGNFLNAGAVIVNGFGRWDGTAPWNPVGTGIFSAGGTPGAVRALQTYDDGSGPALYAAGSFTIAGGKQSHLITRWSPERLVLELVQPGGAGNGAFVTNRRLAAGREYYNIFSLETCA